MREVTLRNARKEGASLGSTPDMAQSLCAAQPVPQVTIHHSDYEQEALGRAALGIILRVCRSFISCCRYREG